jgi:hypothetical protein
MSANRLNENSSQIAKEIVCKSCKIKSQSVQKNTKSKIILMENHLDLDKLVYVEELINKIDMNNWIDFEFNNIPIGRYASYEILLNNKIKSNELNQEIYVQKYKISLKNSLLTALAFEEIIKSNNFDLMFVRNSLYSVNRVAARIASLKKIKVYSFQDEKIIRDGSKSIFIYKWDHHPYQLAKSEIFKSMLINKSDSQISSESELEKYVNNRGKDLSLLSYSDPQQNIEMNLLKEKIGIINSNKIILITLSSGDENQAAETIQAIPLRGSLSMFKNQNEWIIHLMEIAKNKPDLNFIFRVHPRETKNRRDKIQSSNYKVLQEIFSDKTKNVYINFPDQGIPLHDLFKITDVNLNFGSTTGLEALALGIPSICQDEDYILGYPINLGYLITDKEDYANLIESLLDKKVDISVQLNVNVWLKFIKNYATFTIYPEMKFRKIDKNIEKLKFRIFKIGKGVIVLGLILKILRNIQFKVLGNYNIEPDKIYDSKYQLIQLFEIIAKNENHFIKK